MKFVVTILSIVSLWACDRKPHRYELAGARTYKANQPTPDATACPTKETNIAIIDLKSGWWAGDGGDFGKRLIKNLSDACKTLKIAYTHRLTGGGYGNPYGSTGGFGNTQLETSLNKDGKRPYDSFPPKGWDHYDQIWLLSGGEEDSGDLRVSSDEFKHYLKGMVSSKADLFLGGGFGNVYHANTVLQNLGLGAILKPSRKATAYPRPDAGVAVRDRLNVKGHSVFTGVSSLPECVKVGNHDMTSDSIVDRSKIDVLVETAKGDAVIGTAEIKDRLIFIDTGLQRSYAIDANDKESLRYFMNIMAAQ